MRPITQPQPALSAVSRAVHRPEIHVPTRPIVTITATSRIPSSTVYSINAAPSSSLPKSFRTVNALPPLASSLRKPVKIVKAFRTARPYLSRYVPNVPQSPKTHTAQVASNDSHVIMKVNSKSIHVTLTLARQNTSVFPSPARFRLILVKDGARPVAPSRPGRGCGRLNGIWLSRPGPEEPRRELHVASRGHAK